MFGKLGREKVCWGHKQGPRVDEETKGSAVVVKVAMAASVKVNSMKTFIYTISPICPNTYTLTTFSIAHTLLFRLYSTKKKDPSSSLDKIFANRCNESSEGATEERRKEGSL